MMGLKRISRVVSVACALVVALSVLSAGVTQASASLSTVRLRLIKKWSGL